MTAVFVNEEVSHHITPFSISYEALNKLKEIYDSHSKLEIVKLMIKLSSIELKNDDTFALASEVRSIMHYINNTSVEVDIPIIVYVKALYPTYSHYLESLKASGNLVKITFDSLEKKFAEREGFWKDDSPSIF